jgi:hypothetical protein
MGNRYDPTESRFARWLKDGRGSGRGLNYQPWLTVQDVPSKGEVNRIAGAKHRRVHHLLSRLELAVFLDCDWHPDVTEIREQFPIDRAETRAIAERMGVRHPSFKSVDVVMTTDLLVDIGGPDVEARQVAITVKPSAELEVARELEKLEIMRRYWAGRGVPQRIVTEHEICERRRDNLIWLYEWRWLDPIAVPYQGYWIERSECLLDALRASGEDIHRTVESLLEETECRQRWPVGEGLSALRHLGATRRIMIDLDREFDVRGPLAQVRVAVMGHPMGDSVVLRA